MLLLKLKSVPIIILAMLIFINNIKVSKALGNLKKEEQIRICQLHNFEDERNFIF